MLFNYESNDFNQKCFCELKMDIIDYRSSNHRQAPKLIINGLKITEKQDDQTNITETPEKVDSRKMEKRRSLLVLLSVESKR